jgi:single-strand DNA-binding protein
MDLNLVVLSGRLAAPPELRTFDSGSRLVRYLVTCRAGEPRPRVDVLGVTLWNPPPELASEDIAAGTPVWVAGNAQRRFWSETDGRRSRLEIVADEVRFRPQDPESGAH